MAEDRLAELQKKIAELEKEDRDLFRRHVVTGLLFDPDMELDVIAGRMFPETENPRDVHGYDRDSEGIYYFDPETDEKRYATGSGTDENFGDWIDRQLGQNLIPAGQLGSEIFGGLAGIKAGTKVAQRGAQFIPSPIAKAGVTLLLEMIGGYAGTKLSGATMYGARELINQLVLNGDPQDLEQILKDLEVSGRWGMIPFGGKSMKMVIDKFTGRGKILEEILKRAENPAQLQKEATERGVKLTSAEADELWKAGNDIQYYLSRQPGTEVVNFYRSRSQDVTDMVYNFADELLAAGKVADPQEAITRASKKALDIMKQKRKTRAGRIYETVFKTADDVDIAPFINQIDDMIASGKYGNPGSAVNKKLAAIKKQFFDVNGNPITDFETLHNLRTTELGNVLDKLQGGNQRNLMKEVTKVKNNLTELLDNVHGDYSFAREVFDPTRAPALRIENSLIGNLAKVGTDKQAVNAWKALFDPKLSANSAQRSKRVLQAVDPVAWQNIKSFWLKGQLDDSMRMAIGAEIGGGQASFANKLMNQRGQKVINAMFEPQEVKALNKILEITRASSRIPRAGSQTQPLGRTGEEIISDLSADAGRLGLALKNTLERITGGLYSNTALSNRQLKQLGSYEDQLIQALFDPDKLKTLQEVLQHKGILNYVIPQSLLRGGAEVAEEGYEFFTGEEAQATEPPPPVETTMNMPPPSPASSMAPVAGSLPLIQQNQPMMAGSDALKEFEMRKLAGLV